MPTADSKIKELNDLCHSLFILIERLQNFSGNKAVQQELSDVISQRIEDFASEVEGLTLILEDEGENMGQSHRIALDKLLEDLSRSKRQFRKAQVQSKRNVQTQWRAERELLFGNRTEPTNAIKKTKDEMITSKSEEITNALRQMHQMAQAEVAKSALNVEELEYSTKNLKDLQKKYSGFDLLLNGSQILVRHLEEADKWDRIYMLASMGFLALVLAWIVWRRILKAPVMILVWSATQVFRIFSIFGSSSKSAPDQISSISSALPTISTVQEATTVLESLTDHVSSISKQSTVSAAEAMSTAIQNLEPSLSEMTVQISTLISDETDKVTSIIQHVDL